ncbi:MAG: penicillin acylase family protein [Deltaproteobacteria bacterium]|nr:penicillin acylase family protein [Deltaproteobacteria bacterium]MBW2420912.1 penicillin acylase family protein [Deltaproteobacteria bacterium]
MSLTRALAAFVVALAAVPLLLWLYLAQSNRARWDGEVVLEGLTAPVRVDRDEQGVPYIQGESWPDVIRAQGFVMSSDRLYQMELMRHVAQGRLAELVGERGFETDVLVRVVDIPGIARRQVALLAGEGRVWFDAYLGGVNAYLEQHGDDLPLAFSLLSLTPEPWTLHDLVAIQALNIWGSSANWRAELIAQLLIEKLGPERAAEISMISVNPDVAGGREAQVPRDFEAIGLRIDPEREAHWPRPEAVASNSWVSGPGRSAGGKPILANDPHLDARRLPGFFYPIALVTPQGRAVGLAPLAAPGLGLGRTDRMAFGATNGYADMVDLYIEREDLANPGHYLEGARSLPFALREEHIRIRDREHPDGYRSETVTVRSTRRGPILSDHGMIVESGKLLSLRWSWPEALSPNMGAHEVIAAKSVGEALRIVARQPVSLNYILADVDGHIARVPSGPVPIRREGDGSHPLPVRDSRDNWAGFLSLEQKPTVYDPPEGWVGAANHDLVPDGYPFAYSTYFAPSWRYRRLRELMAGDRVLGVDDHWRFMRDVKNTLAVRLAPIFAAALRDGDADDHEWAQILDDWDFVESVDAVAPSLFQTLVVHLALRTYEDELGEELTGRFLDNLYYWNERFAKQVEENAASWFDDRRTDAVETRDEQIRLAAGDARAYLTERFGRRSEDWRWGALHTVTFASPVLPGERAARWLGGGTHPMEGSGETLNRAIYRVSERYDTRVIASARIVYDLSDSEKVTAVLPGGVSGRYFDDHLTDQLPAWRSGEKRHWWFSDAAIREHAEHTLNLVP